MKKPRPNKAALDALPQVQMDALVKWLTTDNLSYSKARAKMLSEYGVKTNHTALCMFFQAHCAALVQQRRAVLVNPPAPATGQALLEIIVDVSQPNLIRLKIIPGSGVRIEGGQG